MKTLGTNTKSKEFVTILESKSKKPSVFQITGINPLRYKYYINNEAVTQFMEASPFTFSINNFSNADYLINAPEIKVPEIFKTDSISSEVKSKIRQFQVRKIDADRILEETDLKIEERWSYISDSIQKRYPDNADSNNYKIARRAAENDFTYKNLLKRFDQSQITKDQILREYKLFTSGLPINNPKFGILEQYREDTLTEIVTGINLIKQFQKEFANEYLGHIRRFKVIDSLVNLLETDNSYRINYQSREFVLLLPELRYYNFYWEKPKFYSYRIGYREDDLAIIKEQILAKQFQLYEEFVLNVATKIGVLIQGQFREYSSLNNALENYTCITLEKLHTLNEEKNKLIKTFDFIQKTSAELQILVSYLDINTALYQSIAKKINTNYVVLLSYLKNLDFITMDNTVQYTLPTHTNLKNVDLVRYTVKREDKVTKAIQTYNYDFWIKGGLKIDFSVGIFGTRLTDNVYNKVLLDTIGGIDKIRITRQDDGRVNFAFGGMVNVTPRNGGSWVNVGGSIGVAYSANQKLQMLAALSFHLGKTERIIVHAGVAFGTIKYLDISANDFRFFDRDLKQIEREKLNDIKERDRVYMLASPDIKYSSYAIPTNEKFVVRPFIGISYNLSKKNALQAVSGGGVKTFSDNLNNPVAY